MACVGICALCGADLADDGERTCDCQRARSSRLVQVVAQAVRLAGREGTDLRRSIRDAAFAARGQAFAARGQS